MMSLISFLSAGAAILAQQPPHTIYNNPSFGYGIIGVGLGVGLASLGAGLGISRLAASSVESMARQPEASGDIRGAMILTAAFIEGVCLFAVVTSLLAVVINLNK
jgi:F-type H+-transporting ATPase subunit c